MTIRKDKATGTWIVDISDGFNPVTGKRNRFIKRQIKTRKEAIKLEQELRFTKFGDTSTLTGATIEMLYQIVVEEDKRSNRKESYLQTQEYNYNRHIKGYFEKAKIELLTYKELEVFRASLTNKGLSNNTVNKLMIQLKKLLDVAVKQGFLKVNPCTQLKKLPVKKKKMDYWTTEDFNHFMSLFKPDEYPYKLFFKVAFSTGMRMGELLGLTWEDINLRRNIIDVNKTLIHLTGKNVLNEPKTSAGSRQIALHSNLSDELWDWKDKQHELLSPFVPETEKLQVFQFVPEIMTRFKVSKKYDDVVERSSTLKRIRIHDLRHSHVAFLIDNEEDPFIIKERIGHASINTTYDIYGHLYPNKQQSLADKLNNAIV